MATFALYNYEFEQLPDDDFFGQPLRKNCLKKASPIGKQDSVSCSWTTIRHKTTDLRKQKGDTIYSSIHCET